MKVRRRKGEGIQIGDIEIRIHEFKKHGEVTLEVTMPERKVLWLDREKPPEPAVA